MGNNASQSTSRPPERPSYAEAAAPLPEIAPAVPPLTEDQVRPSILAEVRKCTSWLDQMNAHAQGVVDAVDSFLRSPADELSSDEKQELSISVRKTIRAHDNAINEHGPRCFKALKWCRARGRAEEVPEADAPCEALRRALAANRDLLTQQLAPRFEIMRATSGTIGGYVKETVVGQFDKER